MLIWDDAQQECKDSTNDASSASLTFFKRNMNTGYKYILSDLARTVTEKTQTALTVASQQNYQLPPDCLWVKSITVTVGSTVYPVYEEESQEKWNIYNQQSQSRSYPDVFFIRPGFGYSGGEISFYPTPSTAGYTITIVYEATDKDLSQDKYTTGTVTVTNGSATVTGSGTTFTANMVGRFFNVSANTGDGMWYKVATRNSNTEIILENVYEGSTGAGVAYQIAEAFNLPEEMHILPVDYALWRYYLGPKKDVKQANTYYQLFIAGLEQGKLRYGTKTRSNIVREKKSRHLGQVYPGHFPSSISE